MSYRNNDAMQLRFDDSFNNLTAREKRAVSKSWAMFFAVEIFPRINTERFRVLYSENHSRPSTPVNVIIGALILKEQHGLSDKEVVENILVDPRYQLALHTTSYAEQPISDKTLQRFRNRCRKYEEETGIDLIRECLTELSSEIAKAMGISKRMRRMDSMMIEANIQRLSRTQVLYRCVRVLLRRVHKMGLTVPEDMMHYLDSNDYNRIFYHANDDEVASAQCTILVDAQMLLCDETLRDLKEYKVLERCFEEQVIVEDDVPRLRSKEDGGMDSGMLQNPADPDATYRKKAGKEYRGYVGNLVEAVGENGSVVVDYDLQQNNHSDSQFLKDCLEHEEEHSEEAVIVADGAYGGLENSSLAEEKNVRLVTTALTGTAPEPIVGEFELSEDRTTIERCPAGNIPTSVTRKENTGTMRASFERDQCAGCPHRDQCGAKVYKTKSVVELTPAAHHRAKQLKYMETEEFHNFARLRNGVETVPSLLRRKYRADRMPVRGLLRTRLFFGFKVAALNVGKFLTYCRKRGNYAQNPVLMGC